MSFDCCSKGRPTISQILNLHPASPASPDPVDKAELPPVSRTHDGLADRIFRPCAADQIQRLHFLYGLAPLLASLSLSFVDLTYDTHLQLQVWALRLAEGTWMKYPICHTFTRTHTRFERARGLVGFFLW